MVSKTQDVTAEERAVFELAKQAAASLRSPRCLCGGKKREEHSFCNRCYYKLPDDVRASLYASFRDGYAKNYAAAKEFLEKLKSNVAKATA